MRSYNDPGRFGLDNSLQVIERNFNGVQGFADALLETDDFYACLASRYFKFLTGYDVDLNNHKDPSNPEESLDKYDEVERLATVLKGLQNNENEGADLKNILIQIINSDYFMD